MYKRIIYITYFIFFFLICGCTPHKKQATDIENAILLEPTIVTDDDMRTIQTIHNISEPKRKIAILFGYGYNDEKFINEVLNSFENTLGLEKNGGSIIPLIFPNDFKRGATGRISLLSGILKDKNAEGLVIVGAPEGTHNALANIQDFHKGDIIFPVVSLLPQDDILGIEAGSDIVIEYVSSSVSDFASEELSQEEMGYVEFVPELIKNSVEYIYNLPLENTGGFTQDSSLLNHVKLMLGNSWIVSRYVDTETGISPVNHFVIEYSHE